MTYDEFLEALRQTPREWLLENGEIRLCVIGGKHCPLSAVAGTYSLAIIDSAKKLGLDRDLAGDIAAAADDDDYAAIRADLVAACGLTEPLAGSAGRRE